MTEVLLDALSAELGSGAAPAEAVAAVLPDLPPGARAEVGSVRDALRFGGDAGAAWREVRTMTRADDLAAAFQVCEDTGASLAAVLTRLAAMAADERRRHDEVGTALAGPRSSAVMLAALPALGVLAGAGLGASPLPFLLRTSAGHLCFFVGVGLDVLGAAWVARLAASAARPPSLS
jgi:tight adherence protein B